MAFRILRYAFGIMRHAIKLPFANDLIAYNVHQFPGIKIIKITIVFLHNLC